MIKLTKYKRFLLSELNFIKHYSIKDAISLLKKFSNAKFNESVDISINLGFNVNKFKEIIRNFVILPYGTGRNTRVAIFTKKIDLNLLKETGVKFFDINELINNIKKGNINFDVLIASPDVVGLLSEVNQILGPRGLMPNIKYGTITNNIINVVKNFQFGQICYCNDKNGIINTIIGKISFEYYQLKENLEIFIKSLINNKLYLTKNLFIKKITLSTTMGPGLIINQNSLSYKK